jgi:hypothetical protein
MNNNELYHYGVLGMKWGVHKNGASYTYAKASIKKDKLNKRATKLQNKADKAAYKEATGIKAKYQKKQAKADKAAYKAEKKQYSLFATNNSYQKAAAKAEKLQFKANKYKYRAEKQAAKSTAANAKALKAAKKYDKFTKKMNKVFTEDLMKSVDSTAISNAKAYIKQYKKDKKSNE